MEEDDMPPPLEDMTAQLRLRERFTGRPAPKGAAKVPPAKVPKAKTMAASASKAPAKAVSVANKSSGGDGGGFAGFSKGFLNAPAPKAKVKPAATTSATSIATKATPAEATKDKTATTDGDIPFIRAKSPGQSAAPPGLLTEVQEAMDKAVPFLQANRMRPLILRRVPADAPIWKGYCCYAMFCLNTLNWLKGGLRLCCLVWHVWQDVPYLCTDTMGTEKDWMNEDLLKFFASSPFLAKSMAGRCL